MQEVNRGVKSKMARGAMVVASVCSLLVFSCAVPSSPGVAGQSLKRDALGHRPGPKGFRTVVIDAGHGGRDSGAVGYIRGAVEKDLALDTAKRLKRKLGGQFKVVMVRSRDKFVKLDKRVSLASRYNSAILVSLHYNSSRSKRTRGPETYYWRVDSHGLAHRIQKELEKVSPYKARSRGLVRRRLRLTRNPKIPSVLVEFGYITNSTEARRCVSPSYRDQFADAVARAIIAQRDHGDEGTGRRPRPITKPLSKDSDPPGS